MTIFTFVIEYNVELIYCLSQQISSSFGTLVIGVDQSASQLLLKKQRYQPYLYVQDHFDEVALEKDQDQV